MDTVRIACIAVSAAPYPIDKPYDYMVPEALQEDLQIGMRVLIPFGRGNRISEGMVLSVKVGEKTRGLKSVLSLLDDEPVLDDAGIRLALWMRERYFCTVYEAIRTILPAGLWFRTEIVYHLTEGVDKAKAYLETEAIPGSEQLWDVFFANGTEVEESILKAACGAKSTAVLKALCDGGWLHKHTEATRHVKDGKTKMVALAVSAEEAMAAVEGKRKTAPLRYAVIQLLSTAGTASQAEICYFTGASSSTITSLKKSGLVTTYEEEKLRIDHRESKAGAEIVLSAEQSAAFETILALTKQEKAAAALLRGVTGSGKTRIYIRLAQEVIAAGKTAIVLVPEIALTPQMMDQFSAYFGDRIAMLHSGLRMTELYDQWKRIRRGEIQLVLGTRSAVFAPLSHIGLIILDEEQEASYQSENPPRYHAREVARYLSAMHRAVLVLGSATPSIESAYAAEQGIYHYAELKQRYNRQALPDVIFADMKDEVRRGNGGVVSERLRQELSRNIERGEQSILLLNRRGNSRMLLCGECGHVPECPRCSVPLTFHSANGRLMCHYCGHSEAAERYCPECGGLMKHIGTGTQKAEEELKALFPGVQILRMDADTVSIRGGHEKILREFEKKKVPILLGTQMVSKGLDFENVTLVGVLAADLALYNGHYAASERAFSLLTQVIGRAGRGAKGGRAVIQTYTPDHEVLQYAAKQDYGLFYQSEIRMRKLRGDPPFSDLFTLVVSGMDESRVLRASAVLRDAMRNALDQNGTFAGEHIQVVGPAPAPITKVNNRYRYHVYLVAKNNRTVRGFVAYYLKAFFRASENRNLSLFVHCNAAD